MKTRVLVGVAGLCGSVVVLGQISAGTDRAPRFDAVQDGAALVPTGAAPDVVCFKISGLSNWAEGSYRAYSVGTTSCNIGTSPLLWQSWDNNHPVIAQNMFRYKTDEKGHGRFEQIGQSWLKHGFCALDLSECGECQGTGCTSLGVGCSDPYTSGRNGYQPNAGPKYQVNATSGIFPYPPADPSWSGAVDRRLQVHVDDIDPELNADARYFLEAHYIHPQDSPSTGNTAGNNASYREVTLNSAGVATGYLGETVQMNPGVLAWRAIDPDVKVSRIAVTGEGTFRIAHRVYDNADGTWDYEYAVHNLDSDRSAGGFSVPVPDRVTVTDIAFNDVSYHSGDGDGNVDYDGSDWVGVHEGGVVRWSTESFETNSNANAIRWDTMYNFRFTANSGPELVEAQVDFFKPGDPAVMTATIDAPMPTVTCALDLSGNGVVDFDDLLDVLTAWGPCAGCPEDFDEDGTVTFLDLLELLSNWGPCPG